MGRHWMTRTFDHDLFRALITGHRATLLAAGYSTSNLDSWHRGRCPHVKTLAKIANLLGITDFNVFFDADGQTDHSKSASVHGSPHDPIGASSPAGPSPTAGPGAPLRVADEDRG